MDKWLIKKEGSIDRFCTGSGSAVILVSFLNLSGKTFLVVGFANRKSIAWVTSQTLIEQGANVLFSVRSEKRKKELHALIPDAEIFICDYEIKEDIESLAKKVSQDVISCTVFYIRLLLQIIRMVCCLSMKPRGRTFCRPCKYHLFP